MAWIVSMDALYSAWRVTFGGRPSAPAQGSKREPWRKDGAQLDSDVTPQHGKHMERAQ
ncbi:MAG: hypothetical protein JWN48_2676 [Myxococcaceae bacterium]|nr:hypothetical protein [Myxococcaceae bacterium]